MHQHTVTPLGSFSVPDAHFDHVHLNLMGLLPKCKGYSYLLTCVDCFTRWPEAFSLPDITASTVANAFVSGWISQFGVPSTITTDCGAQFESNLCTQLMRLIRTTAYHPATLSAVPQTQWLDALPLVLLGIRSCLTSELV